MRHVDEHCEISADEACQGGHQGQSPVVIWLFAAGLVLLAAIAFILISLSAQD